jgi:hypothetical protein
VLLPQRLLVTQALKGHTTTVAVLGASRTGVFQAGSRRAESPSSCSRADVLQVSKQTGRYPPGRLALSVACRLAVTHIHSTQLACGYIIAKLLTSLSNTRRHALKLPHQCDESWLLSRDFYITCYWLCASLHCDLTIRRVTQLTFTL